MGFLLIIINILCSLNGFEDRVFFHKLKFEVDRILVFKEYKRVITSGFLHVGWVHLVMNMFSLYVFYNLLDSHVGNLVFTIIYFASLLGGSLLALYIHRNHGDYSAVGASGAVCGIIFASIALFPAAGIGIIGLPFSIPGWLYGILFVLYSIYGIKSKKDNIGHEAHLGGALVGMIVALLIHPSAFTENYLAILLISVPVIAFIYFIIKKPHVLWINNFYFKSKKKYYSIDHKYNEGKVIDQTEIDRILDKINRSGMNSLTDTERFRLKQKL